MTAPNVLFVAIDSLRADALYGGHIAIPNLDRMMGSGAVFRQCVATTTSTTPSFSSMLTGCYPPRHGVRGLQGYRLSPAVTTMAEAFDAAGYETHAEITGPLVPETGVTRGFGESNHRPGYKVKPFKWVDETVAKMKTYKEPWFMLLHTWEVHRPFRPAPDRKRRWDKAGYEAMVAETDEQLAPIFEVAGDNTIVVFTGDHGEEYPDTRFQRKLHRVARKSRKSFKLDRWFPWLDKRFAAMALGHGFALWEHLVRVPLIVNGPGVPQVDIAEQVRHVDLFPTLAGLCGLEIRGEIDGRSLVPLLQGGSLPEEPAYMEAVGVKLEGKRIAGARTPDWKLLKVGDAKPSLYRLNGGAEPDEKHNVIGRHPEVARKLEGFIEQVNSIVADDSSPMSAGEEAIVEQHLRDLGYL